MAAMLGVSEATARRRFQEYGWSNSERLSPLSDEELDGIVRDIKHDFSQSGFYQLFNLLNNLK